MVLRLFNDEYLVMSEFLRIFALDFRLDLDNFTAQPKQTQIGKNPTPCLWYFERWDV